MIKAFLNNITSVSWFTRTTQCQSCNLHLLNGTINKNWYDWYHQTSAICSSTVMHPEYTKVFLSQAHESCFFSFPQYQWVMAWCLISPHYVHSSTLTVSNICLVTSSSLSPSVTVEHVFIIFLLLPSLISDCLDIVSYFFFQQCMVSSKIHGYVDAS